MTYFVIYNNFFLYDFTPGVMRKSQCGECYIDRNIDIDFFTNGQLLSIFFELSVPSEV